MADELPTADRESLIWQGTKSLLNAMLLPTWMQLPALGQDLTPVAELVVDALLPDLAVLLDRARQQERERLTSVLKLVAAGRAEYAAGATQEQEGVLSAEARVLNLAAGVVAGRPLWGLLPSWRWAEAERLGAQVVPVEEAARSIEHDRRV